MVGCALLNFVIALVASYKSHNKDFKILTFYWAAVIFAFVMTAILSHSPTEIAFAFFSQFFSVNLMCHLMISEQKIKYPWKKLCGLQVLAMLATTYLILKTNVGFTLSVLPVAIAYSISLAVPVWQSLVTNRKESTPVEKAMAVVIISVIVHSINYALFRLDPATAFWGWSVLIIQYQCISVFFPIIINYRRDQKEKHNLQLALEQFSGKTPNQIYNAKDLYLQLELQIAKNKEILGQLKMSNDSLQEEREINDVLIKTISHDLSNPLIVINSYVELLAKKTISEEDAPQMWMRLKNNIEQAFNIITRIRKAIVNKSQADLISVENVSVEQSIEKLLDLFELPLNEKNIKVIYQNTLPPETSVLAENSALVDHVFSNILSNAIKFSHENSEIRLLVTDDNDHVKIDFQDFGIGINQNRLSKKLLQTTVGTRGETGSGFGLMVMNYFVKKFEGSITFDSKIEGPQAGTMVSLKLKKHNFSQAQLERDFQGIGLESH
jgi:signal transduction histidine kinase